MLIFIFKSLRLYASAETCCDFYTQSYQLQAKENTNNTFKI